MLYEHDVKISRQSRKLITNGPSRTGIRRSRSTRRASSKRPAKILKPVETFFDDVDARGVTEPHSAVVAKGRARHDRDAGFAQQTICEVLRGQSELADVDQDVKRSLRFYRCHVRNF